MYTLIGDIGNTLLFERKSGKPLFDINFKKTPKSNVPNEYAADKQLFIEKPERFSKIESNPPPPP